MRPEIQEKLRALKLTRSRASTEAKARRAATRDMGGGSMVEEIAKALEKLAAALRAGEVEPDDLVGWTSTLGSGLELESTPELAKKRARSLFESYAAQARAEELPWPGVTEGLRYGVLVVLDDVRPGYRWALENLHED